MAGRSTIDEAVFAEESDLVLLGARSLDGLNLTVDPATMRLVDKGPAPAAPVTVNSGPLAAGVRELIEV